MPPIQTTIRIWMVVCFVQTRSAVTPHSLTIAYRESAFPFLPQHAGIAGLFAQLRFLDAVHQSGHPAAAVRVAALCRRHELGAILVCDHDARVVQSYKVTLLGAFYSTVIVTMIGFLLGMDHHALRFSRPAPDRFAGGSAVRIADLGSRHHAVCTVHSHRLAGAMVRAFSASRFRMPSPASWWR